jgi:nucleoside-diphosphate-sugar epimerase
MRVFVAGASGVVGTPLSRLLLEAGHSITALTRSEANAERLRKDGMDAVVADVFDEAAVRRAMEHAKPDAVVHQLTAIPGRINPRHAVRVLEPTNRLRTEGTRILLAGAKAVGARRFIAQGISFVLSPDGPNPATEAEPPWLDAPFAPIHRAVHDLETQLMNATELVGIALRYGAFYGPHTAYAKGGSLYQDVLARRVPIIGSGAGVFSHIHVEDAARAALAALNNGERGVYNIVDDEPAPVREWLPYYAEQIGAKKPFCIPRWLGRLGAGAYGDYLMMRQRGVTNDRARAALGWSPMIASWREGFRDRLDR